MKRYLYLCAAIAALASPGAAHAHNSLSIKEARAGYATSMDLNVYHGCKGSPVVGLRLKVPDGVMDAKAAFDPHWTIEYKYRDLDEPWTNHGMQITRVVDEIIWKDPVKVLPADGWYPFRIRMTIPDRPNEVLHFRNITVCEEGTDAYVDLPDEPLSVDDPNWGESVWKFMTATATPAPFIVIRAPSRKQYPWQWTPEQARGVAPD
jgi:uncharacterized protein YcnI